MVSFMIVTKTIKRIELWGLIASYWDFGVNLEISQILAFRLHLGRLWLGIRLAKPRPLDYVPNHSPGGTALKED